MYLVGWDKQEIQIQPKGYAMFGYGMWSHRAFEKRTALYARSFTILDEKQNLLLFCCLDLGCITAAMRQKTQQLLQEKLGEQFNENQFVLTATHTHSGPGGCAYEALYNMPTPGFVPEHLDAIVLAVVSSVENALSRQAETEIAICQQSFDTATPVAWNRSLDAYNQNPEVEPRSEHETHLALNREMQLIGFYRQGNLQAFISFFGVHATCLGNSLNAHDGDNKGYAAQDAEALLKQQGIENPVTIFAQATAGDVSPHFHGPHQNKIRQQIKGEKEYEYAKENGRLQSQLAFTAFENKTVKVKGNVDAVFCYVDLSNIEIPAEFAQGEMDARTSIPCHGTAFAAGTPVDGKGVSTFVVKAMNVVANRYKYKKLKNVNAPDYLFYKNLFASQGAKHIFIEAGSKKIFGRNIGTLPSVTDPLASEMNRQVKVGAIIESPLVPSIVPLQIIKIGQLALICCPGEITTISGQRLLQTVRKCLSEKHEISNVWLCSYCNDYMGYITTNEEYQQQAYEGGHTLFGQWTLAAIQYKYQGLTEQLLRAVPDRELDRSTRPSKVPEHELAKRTNHGSLRTAVSQGEL
ncbi:neutral/alkaline non-lysosomal ceramidase N-terminal domain-containing protein [Acinetobacter gerneri]|jgi:neutral ceramidase|uniref:neutral/alkaline non-lysosomal ceramidase N-terminal domain-containing protein n=1 Tax=Acinetobacter gerneri TaxID=202952 RepID=UPI0023EFE06F|nr:neutral/alkaline non-lysosomal ceramidase N-terminal domain-containing protein [Acinetobacter gerneri]MCH4243940.1 neutral/alkaline non-lysosomal ceramidase N-terminal domain-containing protein [Acinetobacter gerneri]